MCFAEDDGPRSFCRLRDITRINRQSPLATRHIGDDTSCQLLTLGARFRSIRQWTHITFTSEWAWAAHIIRNTKYVLCFGRDWLAYGTHAANQTHKWKLQRGLVMMIISWVCALINWRTNERERIYVFIEWRTPYSLAELMKWRRPVYVMRKQQTCKCYVELDATTILKIRLFSLSLVRSQSDVHGIRMGAKDVEKIEMN